MFQVLQSVAHQLVLFCLLLQAYVLRDTSSMHPKIPKALAAKCFPDLLQHGGSQPVQLYITVDTEDATESTPAAAGEKWWLLYRCVEGMRSAKVMWHWLRASRLGVLVCFHDISSVVCQALSCVHTASQQTCCHGMLAVTLCSGCNAGVATVSSPGERAPSRCCRVKGCGTALHSYLGHTVAAMSYLAGSTQLTLHLQAPEVSEAAAAAVEAAATWQVHQVRQELTNVSRAVFALIRSKRVRFGVPQTPAVLSLLQVTTFEMPALLPKSQIKSHTHHPDVSKAKALACFSLCSISLQAQCSNPSDPSLANFHPCQGVLA
jgi:hypothetical protein